MASTLALAGAASDAATQLFGLSFALNTDAATDSGTDRQPRAATDGEKSRLAVWQSSNTLGEMIGTDNDILVASSPPAPAPVARPGGLLALSGPPLGIARAAIRRRESRLAPWTPSPPDAP